MPEIDPALRSNSFLVRSGGDGKVSIARLYPLLSHGNARNLAAWLIKEAGGLNLFLAEYGEFLGAEIRTEHETQNRD